MSSYGDFPDEMPFLILTSGTQAVAGFSVLADQQLRNIKVSFLKVGTEGGSERIRPMLYLDAAMTQLYRTGVWATFGTTEDFDSSAWLGRIRLDFEDVWLEGGETYYLGVELDDYTPNYPTFYMALRLMPTGEAGWINQIPSPDFSLYGIKETTP